MVRDAGAAAAVPVAALAAAPEAGAATRASAVPAAGSTHVQPQQARQQRYTVFKNREIKSDLLLLTNLNWFTVLEVTTG
jgi:hypothetical protein